MVSATPRNTHKLSVVRNIQDDERDDLGAREVHRSIEMILLLHSFLSWEQLQGRSYLYANTQLRT